MADLRSDDYKFLKDSRPKMVTVGDNGRLQNGHGQPIPGIRHISNIEIEDDNFALLFADGPDIGKFTASAYVSAAGGVVSGLYNTIGGDFSESDQIGSLWNTFYGTPTGTKGTDGKAILYFNANQEIYIENRTGNLENFSVTIFGSEI